jgi:ribosomal-protein-alanine N-acetyltransferase
MAAIDRDLFGADAWSIETFWSELAGIPVRRWYRVAQTGDGVVVGYAGLGLSPPSADVETVAVRADQQGLGWGARLLDELLAEAVRRGCAEVVLEVRADNAAALTLYERRDFTTIASRRRYYSDGTDALILRHNTDAAGR